MTTYEYDDDGRVSRTITVREPEFSEHDLAWMLRSREMSREPRGEHGWPIAVATDPANRGKFYVPAPPTDFAAQVLEKAREEAKKIYGDRASQMVLRVEKRD